jgi:YHS domain-containing protein
MIVHDTRSGILTEPKNPLARDVICGREVKPEHAKGETEYGGETYFFCSEECLGRFVEAPDRYAGATAGLAGGSRLPWPGWPPSGDET